MFSSVACALKIFGGLYFVLINTIIKTKILAFLIFYTSNLLLIFKLTYHASRLLGYIVSFAAQCQFVNTLACRTGAFWWARIEVSRNHAPILDDESDRGLRRVSTFQGRGRQFYICSMGRATRVNPALLSKWRTCDLNIIILQALAATKTPALQDINTS